MNKSLSRVLTVLIPLGAATVWIPPQDTALPAWLVAPLLLFFVRSLAGACDRLAGSAASFFPGEEQIYAAPFIVRLLTLLSAPDGANLGFAAALWFLFGAASYASETAVGGRSRQPLLVFAATLVLLAVLASLAGPPTALSGAALGCAVLLYAAAKRRHR